MPHRLQNMIAFISRYRNLQHGITLLCPFPIGWGHSALLAVVCLSVCPSVCPVPDPRSRMGRRMQAENWQEGSPWHRWPVPPLRGQEAKSQG